MLEMLKEENKSNWRGQTYKAFFKDKQKIAAKEDMVVSKC